MSAQLKSYEQKVNDSLQIKPYQEKVTAVKLTEETCRWCKMSFLKPGNPLHVVIAEQHVRQ